MPKKAKRQFVSSNKKYSYIREVIKGVEYETVYNTKTKEIVMVREIK